MERSLSTAEARAGGDVVAVLADDVVNQIAAGEVVERPASVVKELMDNAVDAGATTITVECEAGGKARIRVTDDGVGMSPADARLCFARHATSKIRSVDDLHELATMGFRGEAMSSIASISRTTLTTRRAADLAATRVVVEHGRVTSVSEIGAATGTTIEVAELFGNVPARLKFLKGEPTEASHVTDTVTRLAMAHPGLHVRLRHNGRTVLDVPPDRDGLARAGALVGARLGQRLHRAFGQEHGITVEAFLASPELAQTTARGVQLFVGRRAIRDRGLLHAVTMGYGELVPRGRYPVAIVLIDAPAGAVDFNVHPQKAEVRFSDAAAVAAAVRHVVRAGVGGAPWLGESPSAATVHMTLRTQAPVAWRPGSGTIGAPGGGSGERGGASGDDEVAASGVSPLAHRYAAQLARPEAPQLRFDRPRAAESSPWRAAEGGPRWQSAVRSVESREEIRAARAVRDSVSTAATSDLAAASLAFAHPDDAIAEAKRAVTTTAATLDVSRAAALEAAAVHLNPGGPIDSADPADPSSAAHAQAPAPLAPVASPAVAALSADPWRAAAPSPGRASAGTGFFSSLRYLGQLQLTYLVCEAAGEMVLIDQHAAHERVEFQRLMERRQSRQDVATQRLLFPSTIEVSPSHVALVEESAALWSQLGYDLEPFGKTSLAIKSVPAGMRGGDPSEVLRELLDDWLEAGASRAVESRLENMLATIACHCAVRAGDRLSSHEVEALLHSMDEVDFRAHCPHGRPVLLRLSLDELARRFGR